MEDKISIIIPVYNNEKYLEKCLNSIVNQTYKNLEIIVVDDGSTDNSSSICDDYAKKDTRIKVIHKENKGVSSARNVGLDIATGTYIGFVDADDYIEENMYETLVGNMKEYNVDISMCNYYIINEENKDFHKHKNKEKVLIIDDKATFYDLLNRKFYKGYMWNKLFKKEHMKNIRFDNNIHMCEDLLFISQIADKCSKFAFDYKCLYNYVIRQGSAYNGEINDKYITVIKAYEKIIPLVEKYSSKVALEYKITYFFWLNDICKKCKILTKEDRKIYNQKNKKEYQEIIQFNDIELKTKLEIFVRYRLYWLFTLAKRIKHLIK